jgi:hypothetical protein
MMIDISLGKISMILKTNILNQSIKQLMDKMLKTYIDKCHPRALEALNELRLFGIRSCAFPDQCKSGVSSFCACLHYVFSDASGPSDHQNLAFLSHLKRNSNENERGSGCKAKVESCDYLGGSSQFQRKESRVPLDA